MRTATLDQRTAPGTAKSAATATAPIPACNHRPPAIVRQDASGVAARIVGVLFLAGFLAYGVGSLIATGIVRSADRSGSTALFVTGAALMLLNSAFVIGIGVLMFPILRAHNKAIAAGYLGTRIFEGVGLAIGVVSLIVVTGSGSPAIHANSVFYNVAEAGLGIGSLFFCALLFRTGLVPRFLAVWGFIGYACFAGGTPAGAVRRRGRRARRRHPRWIVRADVRHLADRPRVRLHRDRPLGWHPRPAAVAHADPDLTMRAITQYAYGTADTWSLGEVDSPVIGADEVLVKVSAAGLDRGTWHLMAGLPYAARLGFGFRVPKNPVPGFDLAGTVVSIGSEVTRFRAGDEVFGIGKGAFAEFAAAREDKLAAKPRNLPFTSWPGVARPGPRPRSCPRTQSPAASRPAAAAHRAAADRRSSVAPSAPPPGTASRARFAGTARP